MSKVRLVLLGALSALVVIVGPAGAGTEDRGQRTLTSRSSLERGLVVEINALRVRRGLRPLVQSQSLAAAARSHSLDMARHGYFAHESRAGATFAQRVLRYYGAHGYRSWRAGENLLWGSPDVSARRAVRMWLESPQHRRILFREAWREIGLSAIHTTAGPRVFDGLAVTVVTADFGARVK